MQIELTLRAEAGAGFSARDLGFLLHKHPDRLHERETAAGKVSIFFAGATGAVATAVLHLDIDPVGLVRGRGPEAEGLLDQYVNDRPYVANSFLSVALGRSYGQSLAGKSGERQDLADRILPFAARVVPVALSGDRELAEALFAPLGYRVGLDVLDASGARAVCDLRIAAEVRLRDLLSHLHVLIPVLDDAKHWWIDEDEIGKLLARGEGWLAAHPARDLIARRALKHRTALVHRALARLAEGAGEAEADEDAAPGPEAVLETPLRLHDQRLDAVVAVLKAEGAASVLDLGCGEGRLIGRLLRDPWFRRIVGVDASVRTLERAARQLRLDRAGESLRERVALQMGSLTYGDRRWQGFDAAALVEVIEHIDPARLSALGLSLFGAARPRLIVVTTPNREYNALFAGMAEGAYRHPDHRFEWTRAEFEGWAGRVAAAHGYAVRFAPLGPVDPVHGAPSQLAVFTKAAGETAP